MSLEVWQKLAVNNNGQFQDVWKLSASSEQSISTILCLWNQGQGEVNITSHGYTLKSTII
jgi:hypothetical protein